MDLGYWNMYFNDDSDSFGYKSGKVELPPGGLSIPQNPYAAEYSNEEWESLLHELNKRAIENIEGEGMPYCEVYHEVLIYDAYWDIDLEMAVFMTVCANCDTTNKEVVG